MLELLIKLNKKRVQNMGLDLEFNMQFKRYRKKFFDLEKKSLIWRNPIVPLVEKIRKDEKIVKSILNAPPQLEGLLPSITEQWLKDMLLFIKEYFSKPFEELNSLKKNDSLVLSKKEEPFHYYKAIRELISFLQENPNNVRAWDDLEQIYLHSEMYDLKIYAAIFNSLSINILCQISSTNNAYIHLRPF